MIHCHTSILQHTPQNFVDSHLEFSKAQRKRLCLCHGNDLKRDLVVNSVLNINIFCAVKRHFAGHLMTKSPENIFDILHDKTASNVMLFSLDIIIKVLRITLITLLTT